MMNNSSRKFTPLQSISVQPRLSSIPGELKKNRRESATYPAFGIGQADYTIVFTVAGSGSCFSIGRRKPDKATHIQCDH